MKFQEYISEAAGAGAAYWLSPKNELISVKDNHISLVITNPEKFSLSKKYINDKYASYGEPVGQEGKAREDIITELVNRKWVRIRRYKDYWSLNVANTQDRKTENLMAEWALGMLNGDYGEKEKDKYIDVVITGIKGRMIRIDMEGLAKGMNETQEKLISVSTIELLEDIMGGE
jgi:hypothetical protein